MSESLTQILGPTLAFNLQTDKLDVVLGPNGAAAGNDPRLQLASTAVQPAALAAAVAGAGGPSVQSVTAAGSTAAGATVLPNNAAVLVTGGPSGGGVALAAGANQSVPVLNTTGNALVVYPPATNGASINAVPAVTLNPGVEAVFRTTDGVNWFVSI